MVKCKVDGNALDLLTRGVAALQKSLPESGDAGDEGEEAAGLVQDPTDLNQVLNGLLLAVGVLLKSAAVRGHS